MNKDIYTIDSEIFIFIYLFNYLQKSSEYRKNHNKINSSLSTRNNDNNRL